MSNRALLKSARLFHLYSGVFLAPALLFFAVTGGLQTFSLHETTKGSNYRPPQILVELGQLHKKQTIVVPVRKAPPAQEAKPTSNAEPKPPFDPNMHGDHTNQQKHDRLAAPDQTPAAAAPTPAPATPPPTMPAPTPQKVHNLIPMKIFFVIVAFGLFFSTLTGLYMAYQYTRSKFTVTVVLLSGIVIPLLLLLF